MKYRDDTADIKVGDRVQVTRETADRGSWRRYKDKYGNVTSVNSSVGEVGVEIGGSVAYFLPEEIRLVRRAEAD